MKMTSQIQGAAHRCSVALQNFPLVLLAPVFCSSASYRLLTLGYRQVLGHKHPIVELLMLLAFSVPPGMIAEAIVARMLLAFREARRPSFAQVREILRVPGLIPFMARLIGLVILWTLLSLALASLLLILGLLVKAFAFAMAHPGAKMPKPHIWMFAFLTTFAVIEASPLSRYSFVLPLFAAGGRGSRELFRVAIDRARPHLLPLSTINVVEYGFVVGIGHALRPFESGWTLRAALVIVLGLLITSAITTWFEMLKADLAFVL